MKITQLTVVDCGGGTRQHVGGFLRFGERDHVADVVVPQEQHHPAVETQGHAGVRGGSVTQGVQQEAETFFGFFGFDAEKIEDLLLHDRVVDSHAAAGRFIAVDDHVIRLGPDLAGVRFEERHVGRDGVAKRVVFGVPALVFFVPVKQGEIEQP